MVFTALGWPQFQAHLPFLFYIYIFFKLYLIRYDEKMHTQTCGCFELIVSNFGMSTLVPTLVALFWVCKFERDSLSIQDGLG